MCKDDQRANNCEKVAVPSDNSFERVAFVSHF
jgi:hypothetical protein